MEECITQENISFTIALIGGLSTIIGAIIGTITSVIVTNLSEEKRFSMLKQQQASKIAELIAVWSKYGTIGKSATTFLSEKEKADYYAMLNQKIWELTIWIPNDDIVANLMKLLSAQGSSMVRPVTAKTIVMDVRKMLNKKTKIQSSDIVHFSNAHSRKLDQDS